MVEGRFGEVLPSAGRDRKERERHMSRLLSLASIALVTPHPLKALKALASPSTTHITRVVDGESG